MPCTMSGRFRTGLTDLMGLVEVTIMMALPLEVTDPSISLFPPAKSYHTLKDSLVELTYSGANATKKKIVYQYNPWYQPMLRPRTILMVRRLSIIPELPQR